MIPFLYRIDDNRNSRPETNGSAVLSYLMCAGIFENQPIALNGLQRISSVAAS